MQYKNEKLANKNGYRQTMIANGAIALDTLDPSTQQEAVELKIEGVFSDFGLTHLINYLEDLRSKLSPNGGLLR